MVEWDNREADERVERELRIRYRSKRGRMDARLVEVERRDSACIVTAAGLKDRDNGTD